MGGNALKSVYTRRYQKEEFEKITEEMISKLKEKKFISQPTISYKSKDSFGDLDVLVLKTMAMGEFMPIIKEMFNPQEEYRNSDCYTIDYKELQVDFILVAPEEWDTSIVYFSYNDLGNFMGRIARNLGFRYGDYGLAYDFPEGERVIVTRNVQKIFTFLGFDHDRYIQGFNTLEDIFDYVYDSKYYNKESFQYENLNHSNKARNMKRKSYTQFIDYIKDKNKEDYQFKEKEYYLVEAFSFFTEEAFKERFDEVIKIKELKIKAKEYFNGNLISIYYPNVEQKEYGNLIVNYKESLKKILNGEDDELFFEKYVINIGDPELIMNEFGYINNLS
jgi:hypothetical protein